LDLELTLADAKEILQAVQQLPVLQQATEATEHEAWSNYLKRMLKNPSSPRLLKKVQMQGGVTHQMGTRGYPVPIR
jgi:hypothetical protein